MSNIEPYQVKRTLPFDLAFRKGKERKKGGKRGGKKEERREKGGGEGGERNISEGYIRLSEWVFSWLILR